MGVKGCWTCRARKVRCDMYQPICHTCVKARQLCRGYGVQLSWPREGDKRRAIVHHDSKPLPVRTRRSRARKAVFLNTSSWDVSLSQVLQEQQSIGKDDLRNQQRLADLVDDYLHTLRVPHLPYLSSSFLSRSNARLLDYFNEFRWRILAPIIDEELAQFVMKVALFDPSSSNVALQGVLTLSSLQLQGHSQSLMYQSRLISMLQGNILRLDRESVLQNLIATMLLYQYEVTNMPSAGQQWSFYLCGAKKIIHAAAVTAKLHQNDTAIVMDWIYYHEVMSEFSIRHWLEADAVDNFCKGPLAHRPEDMPVAYQSTASVTCPIDVLDLIRNVCKRPSPGDAAIKYTDAEIKCIQALQANIYDAIGDYGPFTDTLGSLPRQKALAHLYRCAALIYVNRVVFDLSPLSFSHKRLIREGILLLRKLGSCESAWPLFIIACEASEDEQRMQIWDLLTETGSGTQSRGTHVPLIMGMIERIWKQNDLNDGEVGYIKTLDAVVSMAESLPLFA